jgi:hypothetical protein
MTLIIKKPTGAKLVLAKGIAVPAIGGDVVEEINVSGTNYRVHKFTTVGTFSFTAYTSLSVEYLVVAGGGSGGYNILGGGGGGGGAGGLLSGSTNLSNGSYQVTVGTGGIYVLGAGQNGGNSVFNSITAIGGGGGGGGASGLDPAKVGCSGGGSGSGQAGFGGSGGQDGVMGENPWFSTGSTGDREGGLYGGGGGGTGTNTTLGGTGINRGGRGCVRIIWGAGRSFPSTGTGDM